MNKSFFLRLPLLFYGLYHELRTVFLWSRTLDNLQLVGVKSARFRANSRFARQFFTWVHHRVKIQKIQSQCWGSASYGCGSGSSYWWTISPSFISPVKFFPSLYSRFLRGLEFKIIIYYETNKTFYKICFPFILAAFYATRIRSGSLFSVTMRIRIRPNDADLTRSGSPTLYRSISWVVLFHLYPISKNVHIDAAFGNKYIRNLRPIHSQPYYDVATNTQPTVL